MKTHGHRTGRGASPTYATWRNMMTRCYNRGVPKFKSYGERGICVCDRWHDFASFLADMGVRPDGKTIERINNDGNYELGNCRWATAKEQANNRRSNRVLEYDGLSKTLSEWSAWNGLTINTIHLRLKYGWSVERALTTPHRRAA